MVPMNGCTGSCINGRCINGTCICNAGWSGNQDLWTQDLSRWGGPNLNCPTPIYVLQVAWAAFLVLIALLWLMTPVAIRQQWRKFCDLKNAGKVKYWFHHFPLAYLLFIFFVILPINMASAIVKLASNDLSEVVGATPAATVVFTAVYLLSPSTFAVFLLRALKTFAFSGLDDATSAPAMVAFFHAVTWSFSVVAVICVLLHFYPVVSSSKSPFEYPEMHKLCAQLYLFQQFAGHFLLSVVSAVMGTRVAVAMNGIITNRLDLASRTNQSDLFASVASLRRTRLKIVMVFAVLSVVTLIHGSFLLTIALADGWFVFIGIPYTSQPLITLSLAFSSVLSYTTVPTRPLMSQLRSSAPKASAATGSRNNASDIERVDLEQINRAPPAQDVQSYELAPERARDLKLEQASELEPQQARELEPQQAVLLELEQTPELPPEQASERHVGRAEGWDIGGPAHLAC